MSDSSSASAFAAHVSRSRIETLSASLRAESSARGGFERSGRVLEHRVEVFLAVLNVGDRGLEVLELGARLVGAPLGGGEGLAQAANLGLRRFHARAPRRDIAREPRYALAAIRDGAEQVREVTFGGHGQLLGLDARRLSGLERGLRGRDLCIEFSLRGASPRELLVKVHEVRGRGLNH